MTFQEEFEHFISKESLVQSDDSLLLAVSGGVDSMVLVSLFLKLNYPLAIAHVNHGLRGEESDEDEKLVKKFAEKNQLPWFSKRISSDYWTGKNRQEAAREFRYEFFNEIAEKNQYSKIVTAHHLDDQIETTVMHLVRGCGLRGLIGIPIRNENIIRPLLFARKQKLLEFAREVNIPYREDKTNLSNTYTRNFIRNEILPLLEQVPPGENVGFSQTLVNLQKEHHLFQDFLEDWKVKNTVITDNLLQWNLADIKRFRHPETLLFHLVSSFGFNIEQCQDMLVHHVSIKHWISNTHEVWLENDRLFLFQLENKSDQVLVFTFHHLPDSWNVGKKTIHILWDNKEPEKTNWVLDPDKIILPLTIRPWQSEDVFRPVQMKGKKKEIRKIISELKIPMVERKSVQVVVDGSGEVIALLPGFLSHNHVKNCGAGNFLDIRENGQSLLYTLKH